MKPLIYIAGPYTCPDPVLNTRKAVAVAESVLALGGAPVVPHLTMLWHLISPKPVDEWYRLDLDVLEHCAAVVRFAGASAGADKEVAFAQNHGIPVYYGTDDPDLHALCAGGAA